jgi:hypothetical protein
MPSETHQIGYAIDTDTECVFALVPAQLGWSKEDESGDATLADLGVADVDAWDVWRAVYQEFGERTLGSETDLYRLDAAMMAAADPVAMAAELTNGGQRGA